MNEFILVLEKYFTDNFYPYGFLYLEMQEYTPTIQNLLFYYGIKMSYNIQTDKFKKFIISAEKASRVWTRVVIGGTVVGCVIIIIIITITIGIICYKKW